jgi:hypothetical protein
MKFYENPSRESRVVPCGWTDRRTETDRHDKLIIAFRNFAIAPKNRNLQHVSLLHLQIKRFPRIHNILTLFIFVWGYELHTAEDFYRVCAKCPSINVTYQKTSAINL